MITSAGCACITQNISKSKMLHMNQHAFCTKDKEMLFIFVPIDKSAVQSKMLL